MSSSVHTNSNADMRNDFQNSGSLPCKWLRKELFWELSFRRKISLHFVCNRHIEDILPKLDQTCKTSINKAWVKRTSTNKCCFGALQRHAFATMSSGAKNTLFKPRPAVNQRAWVNEWQWGMSRITPLPLHELCGATVCDLYPRFNSRVKPGLSKKKAWVSIVYQIILMML